MAEKWYDDLPDDFFESAVDRKYRESFGKIRQGLGKGLSFDEACATIDVDDEALRKQIIDDMLKVFLAEEHFAKKIPIEDLAKKLKVSTDLLENAKQKMFDEVSKNDPEIK